MKTEKTFDLDFYDHDNEWIDNDPGYDTCAAASARAEDKLRGDVNIGHVILSKTTKTELKRFSLTLRERAI